MTDYKELADKMDKYIEKNVDVLPNLGLLVQVQKALSDVPINTPRPLVKVMVEDA